MSAVGRKYKRKLEDSTNTQNDQTASVEQDTQNQIEKQNNKKPKVQVDSQKQETPISRRSQRSCVLNNSSSYKENIDVSSKERKQQMKNDTIGVKQHKNVKSESEALENTKSNYFRRRLVDFAVVDSKDVNQQIQRFDLKSDVEEKWFIKGSVIKGGSSPNSKEEAFTVESRFGPVESWKVDYSTQPMAEVVLTTKLGEYVCYKPAANYRKDFQFLKEQVELAYTIFGLLDSNKGGSLDLSLEQATAKLARTKVWKNKYTTPMIAILSNANFLVGQLKNITGSIGTTEQLNKAALFKSLQEEIKNPGTHGQVDLGQSSGGIVIRDREENKNLESECNMNQVEETPRDGNVIADEEFARRLQAEMDAQENRKGNRGKSSKEAYIQVSMEEIADDYPVPQFYKSVYEETDELLLADDEVCLMHRDDLPRCVLDDFVIYNAEGLYSTLELLPLIQGVDPDLDIYASGQVMEDDSEWTGGRMLGITSQTQHFDGAGAGSSGTSNMPESGVIEPSGGMGGMRIYLSQIREWVVEYSSDMMFIWICTSAAWYKLCRPHSTYTGWFDTIIKCARIAVHVMKLIDSQVRASRLSFNDVVKALAQQDSQELTYISKKVEVVKRYIIVHGQLILNQFRYYPNKSVQNCAFVSTLKQEMMQMRHSKLYQSKVKQVKQLKKPENQNPMRQRQQGKSSKPRPMPATATVLVRNIWLDYFKVEDQGSPDVDKQNKEPKQEFAQQTDEEEEEDEEDNGTNKDENMEIDVSRIQQTVVEHKLVLGKEIRFEEKCERSQELYHVVLFGEDTVTVGDVLELQDGTLGMLQCINGVKKTAQLRLLLRGCDTMLADAAAENELFMTEELLNRQLTSVKAVISACLLRRQEDHSRREQNQAEDLVRKSQKQTYIFRSMYLPEKGMFASIPQDLRLGQHINREKQEDGVARKCAGENDSFVLNGIKYKVGDAVLLLPGSFGETLKKKEKDGIPDPYNIAEIVDLRQGKSTNAKVLESVRMRQYFRPHQLGIDEGYKAGLWEIYKTEQITSVSVDNFVNKCYIVTQAHKQGFLDGVYHFLCCKSIDLRSKEVSHIEGLDLPENAEIYSKGPAGSVNDGIALATMDIFAGCGGLTEGMHQARAVNTKWAIEFEQAAAEAYRKNHPEVTVFNSNCNVILQAAMRKAGKEQECVAHTDALKEAEKLTDEQRDSIPLPGEVQFITGGPPCQGYSGMNRFNTKTWSVMQNSMVMAFLSYVDFYRPRYFLLENVKNFLHHNDGRTLRLVVRTLLELGYQVRVGLLNAGLFGVPQSRRRTFVLAALPGDKLPDWPAPLHVFKTQNLTISFKDGHKFHPVPPDMYAPLRSITVRDAIGDLPPIENGDAQLEREYSQEAVSEYQKCIRGSCDVLKDHICKTLDELNYERCKHIPHDPRSDWRVLLEVVKNDPTKEKFKGKPLVPWCLPNTAARHNNWQGLFGRLDLDGFFPTSTTDPNPMGKVGRVFHPNQNRIVSVRECARAQGFPDHFVFHGTIQNKHRQVGNAVPPPLAKAIGIQLRKVLDEKENEEAMRLMHAQL